MSLARNKPKPTYETCLVVNFGMHFLTLFDDAPAADLFSAFISAYPLVGSFSDKRGVRYGFKKIDGPASQNDIFWLKVAGELFLKSKYVNFLKQKLGPYKDDSFAVAHLRDTLLYLKKMVYSATVAPPDDVGSLVDWIEKYAPSYKFEKTFWTSPGNTSLSGNPSYYWSGDEKVTKEQADFGKLKWPHLGI